MPKIQFIQKLSGDKTKVTIEPKKMSDYGDVIQFIKGLTAKNKLFGGSKDSMKYKLDGEDISGNDLISYCTKKIVNDTDSVKTKKKKDKKADSKKNKIKITDGKKSSKKDKSKKDKADKKKSKNKKKDKSEKSKTNKKSKDLSNDILSSLGVNESLEKNDGAYVIHGRK